ncbi:MAG: restriction endonuclease [bacterium]|nr:restriction endonuclease [bacterium]
MAQPSDIPVGSQFTPDLVDLSAFLDAIIKHSGDKPAMERAIARSPVRIRPYRRPPTRRQASLPLEAARQYGLIEPTPSWEATARARGFAELEGDDLHRAFARHILLNLGGLRVVEAAQQMAHDGLKITGDSLAGYLTDQGFRVGVHNTAINSLRKWLAEADVFPKRRHRAWEVDPASKESLVGMSDETIAALVGLGDEQQAFVESLCRIEPDGWYPSADVRDLTESIMGRRVDRANIPKTFLEPLHEARLIEYTTRGTSGGKTSHLRTTDRFDTEVLGPFMARTIKQLDPSLIAYYRRRPTDIRDDLTSKDRNTKGEALEALAIWVMRLLGLRFVGWRKRAADETAHAEVDVLLAGTLGTVPTRWQVQCKNTPSGRVSLEDIAKEIGISLVTKATIVLIFANCQVTAPARDYAQEVMKHTALTVMILDRDDLNEIIDSPGRIATILRREAHKTANIPRHGADWLAR